MDITKWRTSYETGISSMDEQHHKLISLINTMYRVLRQKEDHGSVERVLIEMSDYAKIHLSEEEALLQEKGFAGYEEHLLLHNNYLKKTEELTEEWGEKDESAANKIYSFLRQWWLEHIVEEDQKYGAFLKEKGVN